MVLKNFEEDPKLEELWTSENMMGNDIATEDGLVDADMCRPSQQTRRVQGRSSLPAVESKLVHDGSKHGGRWRLHSASWSCCEITTRSRH
jgi:hypothetical protein